MECEVCGHKVKTQSGLDRHRSAKHPMPEGGPVETAVRLDLRGVNGSDGLQASAVKLAARLDEGASARDLPGLAAELRQTLSELGVTVTEEKRTDLVDELAEKRRADVEASKDSARAAAGERPGGP